MTARGCLLLLSFLVVPLAGCLGSEPGPGPEAAASPDEALHPLLPGVAPALPSGPGVVRYVVHDSNETTRLVGFELKLDPADLHADGWSSVEIVPFGDVEEWVILTFENGRFTRRPTVGIPYEIEADYSLADSMEAAGLYSRGTYARHLYFPSDQTIHLVVAVRGDGGLAIVPDGAGSGEPPSKLIELLKRPGGPPNIIGEGHGMTFARFDKIVFPGLTMHYRRQGTVDVEKDLPTERSGSPVTALTVRAPAGLSGWTWAGAAIVAFDGAGHWHGEIAAGEAVYERGGPWILAGPDGRRHHVGDRPMLWAHGDTAEPVSTTITVLGAGDISIMQLEQITLGASLAHLTGLLDEFQFESSFPASASHSEGDHREADCRTLPTPRCLDGSNGSPNAPLRGRVLGGP